MRTKHEIHTDIDSLAKARFFDSDVLLSVIRFLKNKYSAQMMTHYIYPRSRRRAEQIYMERMRKYRQLLPVDK
jgi:hypothetical protein